ncbi:MAG: rhodanese-like domain-containing protein, partial [Bacteroidia bacterium]
MKEITARELKELIDKKADFQLIDVREQHEYDEVNLNGVFIPMGEVMGNVDKIAKDKQVVVHCRSGKRSAAVIQALEN